ncbi:AAA family ATPase [Anaerolineales bacterium]
MSPSIQEVNRQIRSEALFVQDVIQEVQRFIVGQNRLVQRLLIALLADGHLLIEGVPGLAKSLAVKTLASTIDADFKRIQFTPDLLPSDLIGTQIYYPATGEFKARLGPIFSNIILADEINRASAKVQSALLEAMEEKQVTIGDQTYPLGAPLLVLATQNPIEQEGTFPLPEAQLDRFMMKVQLVYPNKDEEREIMRRMGGEKPAPVQTIVHKETILAARETIQTITVAEQIEEYILNIIFATRNPAEYGLEHLAPYIELGASPRASLALVRAGRALAFMKGRGFVKPDDVKQLIPDILRHRILLSFEAQAQNITVEQVLNNILKRIEAP